MHKLLEVNYNSKLTEGQARPRARQPGPSASWRCLSRKDHPLTSGRPLPVVTNIE